MSDLRRLTDLAAAGDYSPAAVIAVNYFLREGGPASRDEIQVGLKMGRSAVTRILSGLFETGFVTKDRAGRNAPTIYTHARWAEVEIAPMTTTVVETPAVEQVDEIDALRAAIPQLVRDTYRGFVGWTDPQHPEMGPADEFAAAVYCRADLTAGLNVNPDHLALVEREIIEALCEAVFGARYSGSWAAYTRQWSSFGETPFETCCAAISKVSTGPGPDKARAFPSYMATATKTTAGVAR